MLADVRYTPGHGARATAFMARRRASSHAAFVLPWLRPRWRVLDVGCGPGTITADLAARVPQGTVVGIDMNAGQVARARRLAAGRGLENVRFTQAALGSLAFAPASFDLVFAHAVVEHLAAPARALAELRALLVPGGLIALRSPDWGGFVVEPETPAMARALAAYEALQASNGGDLRAGRRLAGLLAEAGFGAVERSASYEIYEPASLIAGYLADQLEGAGQGDGAVTLRAWAALPGAMFAQAWFEAVGRAP